MQSHAIVLIYFVVIVEFLILCLLCADKDRVLLSFEFSCWGTTLAAGKLVAETCLYCSCILFSKLFNVKMKARMKSFHMFEQ
ncbi:hypothetical protein MKX03_031422, partial [Papaver bracteatum]